MLFWHLISLIQLIQPTLLLHLVRLMATTKCISDISECNLIIELYKPHKRLRMNILWQQY